VSGPRLRTATAASISSWHDAGPTALWHNKGDGPLRQTWSALACGVSLNGEGQSPRQHGNRLVRQPTRRSPRLLVHVHSTRARHPPWRSRRFPDGRGLLPFSTNPTTLALARTAARWTGWGTCSPTSIRTVSPTWSSNQRPYPARAYTQKSHVREPPCSGGIAATAGRQRLRLGRTVFHRSLAGARRGRPRRRRRPRHGDRSPPRPSVVLWNEPRAWAANLILT